MLKKTITLLLTLVLALGAFGILPLQISANALESTGNSTLDAFINDSRWTNGVSWGASKMPNISPYQSWGCAAYCADYVKYCYNNNNPRSGEAFYSASETRAGDVITVGNPSDGNGHWFVVLKRSGNSLYVAEGSYAGRVRIGWNYTISGNGYTGTGYGFNTGYHYLANEPTSYNPYGFIDSIKDGEAEIRVRGWAFDADDYSTSIDIHVYIGGPAGNPNAEGYCINANIERPDVNAVYGCGNYHGFDSYISTSKRGTQDVYIYAINIGGGQNVPLGSGTVTITEPANAPTDSETPDKNEEYASTGILNIGDKVKFVASLKFGDDKCIKLADIIASIVYDTEVLEIEDTSNDIIFPNYSPTINATQAGIILFNAADGTKGFVGFKDGGSLVEVAFNVKSAVDTTKITFKTSELFGIEFDNVTSQPKNVEKININSGIICTAETICRNNITDTEKPTDSDTLIIVDTDDTDNALVIRYGDIDDDKFVTMTDVVYLQRNIAKLIGFDKKQQKCADVNRDGEITMLDVTTMQKFIAKLIDKF